MEPIAIVGMACRFPRAPSPEAFWELLRRGDHGIGPVPRDRWDAEAMYSRDPKEPGKVSGREGAFLEQVDGFDAPFFGISPREATQMDPQQRILLELAHEALEDACIPSTSLAGSNTAVYVGVMSNDYLRHQTADDYRRIDVHTGGGAGYALLSNRLSYQLDLHGPSMSIDSACSSSLVAVFHGCQALWLGQSDLALVGGTNLMLDPSFNVFYSKAGLLSPGGRCRTFDAGADGLVRGEGAGLLVLKRERDALRDGDLPYAVVCGGAVNHGGRSNGITAPNRWAQEALLRAAWQQAGVRGDALQYVELHGTGTRIGDTIEANALGAALQAEGCTRRVAVGSVKTNIGHQEGAAGVAGLMKLALSMHHRTLVPSLWFDEPNPTIDFATLPLEVNTATRPWPAPEGRDPRLAAISSFGLGGTNVHLVLAEPGAPASSGDDKAPAPSGLLLILSARSAPALRALAEQVRVRLGEADAGAVCRGALRRNLYEHRLAVTAPDGPALQAALGEFLAGRPAAAIAGVARARPASVRLVIPPARSPDWPALARWLARAPAGRRAWEACRAACAGRPGPALPPLADLAKGAAPRDAAEARLWAFAAQLGLVRQLLGTLPKHATLVADGLEQLAALCAADAITLGDALSWLDRGLGGAAPVAKQYRIHCEFGGEVDPAPERLSWDEQTERWRERLGSSAEPGISVIANLGALPAEAAAGAHLCLVGSEDDFGRLFAGLAVTAPLDLGALGEGSIARLPTYPWQRERHWLPAPAAASSGPPPTPPPAEATSEGPGPLRTRLLAAAPSDRELELRSYLRQRVAEALRMRAEQVDPAGPLNALGMDSLTAVEIKNRIERDLGVAVPVVKFLDGYSTDDFVALIAGELRPDASAGSSHAAPPPAPGPNEDDDVALRVAALSMDEVETMLAAMRSGGHLA